MGKIGCTIDGNLDDPKFSKPMPWIGIYVAAASAACALAMAMDVLHGLRRIKLWFPCNFYSLNATTLMFLAAATKLSVDLNTSMPRQQERIALMFLMLIFLLLMISSAGVLMIPTLLTDSSVLIIKECGSTYTCKTEKLEDEMMKFWTMACVPLTPTFVTGRVATCSASGGFCLLSTGIYAEHMLRSYFLRSSFKFCNGDSEYKWSTTLILVTHTVAIGVGTLPQKTNNACKLKCFKLENYWIHILLQWKESPSDFRFCGRHGRKFAHKTKNKLLHFCIWIQLLMVWLLISCHKAIRMLKCNNMVSSHDIESHASLKTDLSHYVLHLEGEELLMDLMMQSNRDVVGQWIGMGKKEQPKHLIKLLEKVKSSPGFKGVHEFDQTQIPSLDLEEPPNCWALPIVTLTSIAIALPDIDFHSIKEKMCSHFIFKMYIKVVEENLDDSKDLVYIRNAAELVWVEVDLCYRWLDVDLYKTATEEQNPKDVLEVLSEKAKQGFTECRKKGPNACLKESPLKWPTNMLAANCMYRICQTLLRSSDSKELENSKIMCLSYQLQRVIFMQCRHGTIEERAQGVRSAILLLRKAESVLEILRSQPLPSSALDQLEKIDHRHTHSKEIDYLFLQ
ncbi:unnamed protein product [Withania somnifera]